MKGADAENYFAIFDRELNELVSPTQGSPLKQDTPIKVYNNNILVRAREEGRIVELVYDMEGNRVGRFDEKGLGYSDYIRSYDGVFLETRNGWIPVDRLGEPLYDKVNITNAVDVGDMLFTLYKEFLETAS